MKTILELYNESGTVTVRLLDDSSVEYEHSTTESDTVIVRFYDDIGELYKADEDEAIEFAQCSAHFGDAQWFEMGAQPIEDHEVEG